MEDSSESADEDALTALQMLDLMSLGGGSSSRSGGSGITCSRQNLRSWHPWTNSVRLPRAADPPDEPRLLTFDRAAPAAGTIPTTTKAAGGIYDSILRAKPASGCRGTNNNTKELEGGLKDVQTHASGGHRTTIITRLGSASNSGGGVVDFNFVMDTVSTNNGITKPGVKEGQAFHFEDSNKSDDVTWIQDIGPDAWKRQQQQLLHSEQLKASGGGGGGSGGSGGGGGGQSETANPGSASEESLKQDQQAVKKRQRKDGSEDSGSQLPGDSMDFSPATRAARRPPTSETSDSSDDGEGEGEGESESPELDEEEEQPVAGEEKQGRTTSRKKLSICHLQKEGVLIGCMNVFADVMKREFVVLLTDRVVEAFLLEPSQFRAIARRTGCEIEVTRRILNKRIGSSWVKYLVLTIKGPNMMAINQCDLLMIKVFPPYKHRKEYLESAHVSLFVKESYPDNSKLYFNFQRTGPTRVKLGDLRLQTPFDSSSVRPLEHTPWKYADSRLFKGMLEPRNLAVEHTIQHVYPEWGSEVGNYIEKDQKWEKAGDMALDIEKKKNMERSLRVKGRKMEAETLFAEEN